MTPSTALDLTWYAQVHHIHSRIGTTQSSQCPDPTHQTYESERTSFENVWKRMVQVQRRVHGQHYTVTFVPEYGSVIGFRRLVKLLTCTAGRFLIILPAAPGIFQRWPIPRGPDSRPSSKESIERFGPDTQRRTNWSSYICGLLDWNFWRCL
jgi:hypothetical protein